MRKVQRGIQKSGLNIKYNWWWSKLEKLQFDTCMTFEKIAKLLFAIDFEPKNMDSSLVANELLTPLVTSKVLVFPLQRNNYSLML